MAMRFRDINKTMAWAPGIGNTIMDMLADVAISGGVPDPFGLDMSDADLSRADALVTDLYSTRAYLEQ